MEKIMVCFGHRLPYYLVTLFIFTLDMYIFKGTSTVLGFHMTLKWPLGLDILPHIPHYSSGPPPPFQILLLLSPVSHYLF